MSMDDAHKAAVEKLLKDVVFNARREIEKVLREALASGRLKDGDNPPVQVTLSSEKLALNVTIHKRIEI